MRVSSQRGGFLDPISTALITWVTTQVATAGQRAIGRAWKGDAQSKELVRLARQSVASCVKDAVAPFAGEAVTGALLLDYDGTTDLPLSEYPDLQHAILAALEQRLEVLNEQGFDVDARRLVYCLEAKIRAGIIANGARNGVLKTVAELLYADRTIKAQEEIIQKLGAIHESVNFDRLVPDTARATDVVGLVGFQNARVSATPTSRASISAYDIQFSTEFWLTYLEGDIADQLLAADRRPVTDKSSPLRDLDRLAAMALGMGNLSIAVAMESAKIAVRVLSQEQFWSAILADFALRPRSPSNLKWFLKEMTVDGSRPRARRIEMVWDCIYRNFLVSGSGVNREDLFRRLVNTALETTSRDVSKRQLRFLLERATHDSDLRSIFRTTIDDFCRAHPDLTHNRLSDLLYLIGDSTDDLQRYDPELVLIEPTGNWPYQFEVMRRPLTVGAARALSPMLGGDRGNSLYPFRFLPRQRFQSHNDFYENMRRELTTIVRLMPSQADKDNAMQWDIPTYWEWLRLAGCEGQRFPWGNTFEPGRANLSAKDKAPRIRPVGSFPAGVSRHGIDDCCGNVYEIVRLEESSLLPRGFGLMGHSYLSSPEIANCRIAGRFKPRNSDSRWNIGVRLVRYDGSEEHKRRAMF